MQQTHQTTLIAAASKALNTHETHDSWAPVVPSCQQPTKQRGSHQQTMSLTSALGLVLLVLVTLVFAVGPCLFMRAPVR